MINNYPTGFIGTVSPPSTMTQETISKPVEASTTETIKKPTTQLDMINAEIKKYERALKSDYITARARQTAYNKLKQLYEAKRNLINTGTAYYTETVKTESTVMAQPSSVNTTTADVLVQRNLPYSTTNLKLANIAKGPTGYNPSSQYTNVRYYSPQETVSGVSTNNIMPSNVGYVRPAEEVFGRKDIFQKAQSTGESLNIAAIKNPVQAGYYQSLSFGLGAISGAGKVVYDISPVSLTGNFKPPLGGTIGSTIELVTSPVAILSSTGQQLFANPGYTAGELVGSTVATGGLVKGALGVTKSVYTNIVNKYEPVRIEAQLSKSTYTGFRENIAFPTAEGFKVLSGVEDSRFGGLYKIDSRYYKIFGEGVGETVNLPEGSQVYRGTNTFKVQEFSYVDASLKNNVGRPSTTSMNTVALVNGGESSRVVALSSIKGRVPVNRITVFESKPLYDNVYRQAGVSFDVSKKFVPLKSSPNLFASTTQELLGVEGIAKTGESYTQSLRRTDLLSTESRPFENSFTKSLHSNIGKVKNAASSIGDQEILGIKTTNTPLDISVISESVTRDVVKTKFVGQKLRVFNKATKNVASGAKATSALTPRAKTQNYVDTEYVQTPKSLDILSSDILPSTKQTTKLSTPQVSALRADTRVKNIQAPRTEIKVLNEISTQPKTATQPLTEQVSKQSQVQAEKQLLKQSSTLKSITVPVSILKAPVPNTPTYKSLNSKKASRKLVTSVKRKGRFVPIGYFEDLSAAFSRGENVVRSSAAASFKVEENNKAIKPLTIPRGFGFSKRDENVVIQKRENRITSFGEKQDITFKGLRTLRQRKGVKLL